MGLLGLLTPTPRAARAPQMVDLCLRLALGAVLIYASAGKLLHPHEFSVQVQAYHMLPDVLVNVTAVWLPWLELLLGASLISGRLSEGAAVLTSALFAAFWLALLANYFRGINVDCGCFSTAAANEPGEAAPMLWYIGRDALLLALALLTAKVRLGRAAAPAE